MKERFLLQADTLHIQIHSHMLYVMIVEYISVEFEWTEWKFSKAMK